MVIEEPIVNTAPTEVTDQKVPEGKIISGVAGVVGELSPNPAGSGYVKQVVVDSLSSVVSPEPNVLYIVGDKKYKYLSAPIVNPGTNEVLVPAGWNRVGARADSFSKEGERHDPKIVNEASRKPDGFIPPRVFNEPVALNGGVTIKGKTIEELIGQGGGSSEDEPKIYEIEDDLSTLPSATVAQLKVGDIVVVASSDGNTYSYIVSRKEEGVGELSTTTSIYFVSVGSVVEEYRFVYDEENQEWAYDSDYSEILENTKLYLHRLLFTDDIAEIITSDATPFTTDTIKTWLTTNGYTSTARALCFVNKQMTKISDTEVNVYVGVNMTGSNLRKCYYRLTLTAGTGINTITLTQAQFNTNLQNDIVIEL